MEADKKVQTNDGLNKWINCICVIISMGILLIVCASFFDYYYDLNDDVWMKDILSGRYTGVAQGYNIQMLYPVSFLIAILYRIFPQAPVYGYFLMGCQILSITLILHGILKQLQKIQWKIVACVSYLIVVSSMMLWHLIFIQYTFTCAMLGAGAIFLFWISEEQKKPLDNIRANLGSILLVILAYNIRSEMLLLLFPLMGVAGMCKWGAKRPIFTRERTCSYLGILGAMCVGLLLSQLIHMSAYGSPEWREFQSFFDSRTQVYDFYGVPAYEDHKSFYDSVGMKPSSYELLINYNFGLDDAIDAGRMEAISDYCAQHKQQESIVPRLISSFQKLIYRTRHSGDFPWNAITVFLYLCIWISVLRRFYKERDEQAKISAVMTSIALLFVAVVRTLLWMYILVRGRDPIRITDSLYLVEIVLLIGMAFYIAHSSKQVRLLFMMLLGSVLIALCNMPASVQNTKAELAYRETVNQPYQEMLAYCKNHPDDFYFWDVYSSVAFSEKMFGETDNSISNFDLMGGWLNKSPLNQSKWEHYGFDNMQEALLKNDNVYYLAKIDADPTWLCNYYADCQLEVELVEVDTIADYFCVYKVVE